MMTQILTDPNRPILLTLAEAASILRIHRHTLYRIRAEGRAKFVVLGGAIRISTDEVARLATEGYRHGGANQLKQPADANAAVAVAEEVPA